MSDPPGARAKKKPVPWRGRKRVKDARERLIHLRCTDHERAAIKAAAAEAGFSVGAFLRLLALGDAGPRAVRKPPIELGELVRILGALGKIGSNVNQIAKEVNTTRNLPSWSELAEIKGDIAAMRVAVLKGLGRDHQG
jgi:Bacterial mobilisation protein (MobC)